MIKKIKKVFVSGCYDLIHAGHIQFFEMARALGNHLTVCFASDEVLRLTKGRNSSLPESHKEFILGSLKDVDAVVKSSNLDSVFDFIDHLKNNQFQILAVTEDDKNIEKKKILCRDYKMELVVLPKNNRLEKISTTNIINQIRQLDEVPLRVDFGGGWLDVPRLSSPGAYIVNCAITPKVSLADWPYQTSSGLGGSAAYSILQAKNGVKSELALGVGWQDPAVIMETGLCVWRSGLTPVLEAKHNPDWLTGKLLILWTDSVHLTPSLTGLKRDYRLIIKAGALAKQAAAGQKLDLLAKAITCSYQAQIAEGMAPLSALKKALAWKYLGGGHGGYALYLFRSKTDRDQAAQKNKQTKIIEPHLKPIDL